MIRKILLAFTLLYGTTPFASQAITDNTAKTCVVGAGVLGCWLRYSSDKFQSHKISETMGMAGWAGLAAIGVVCVAYRFTPGARINAAARIANEVGTELAVRHNVGEADTVDTYLAGLNTISYDNAFRSLDRLNGKIRTAETLLYKAQRDIGSEATDSEVKAVGSLLNGLGIKVNERTCFLRRQSTFTEGVAATWYPKK